METFFGHPIHELMAITFIATDLVALKVEFAEQSKELTNRCMVSRDLQGSSTIGARLPSQMAIMFSGLLGLLIFLLAAIDNPFRGAISVGPEAFELVYKQLMQPGK
jgi:hypothetical protein